MKKTKKIFNVEAETLADFEANVIKQKALGATHIIISNVNKSRWLWERDLSDPYPNWGMLLTSLFSIIVPEELKEWMSEDQANKNFDLLKKRLEILKKHGLKAAARLAEPFYLPEEVYRAHPDWRGPRCDHPRRAKNYYYSPCIDNEEILAIYRKTIKKLCEEFNIEHFFIDTNDSGGGICWSSGLYAGVNGPTSCKDRSPADRIIGFLSVFQDGAKDAGIDACVEMNSNIGYKESEYAMDAMWPLLKNGMSLNKKDNRGKKLTGHIDFHVYYDYTLNPVKNILLPFTFIKYLEESFNEDCENIYVNTKTCDNNEYFKIIEEYNKKPSNGLLDRTQILQNVAYSLTKNNNSASKLVQAWKYTEDALIYFMSTGIEGLITTSANQRWINRPFILFPDELTSDEKDYYRAFLFQATDEAHANDMLDVQNSSFIRGYSGVFLAKLALKRAITCLNDAIVELKDIEFDGKDLYIDRMDLLICFFNNANNVIAFQHLVDETDYERVLELSPEWPQQGDEGIFEFEAIVRTEIDNTNRMIELIKGREGDMIQIAKTHELEDIFLFSPKLCEQLKKKTNIMWDHLLDGKRLYTTPNK